MLAFFDPDAWLQLGVSGAALLTLVLLVKFVVTRVGSMQTEVLTFIGNHMSKSTEALTDVVANLAVLNDRVETLHDDNVAQAAHLAHADKTITRKVKEQAKSPARA